MDKAKRDIAVAAVLVITFFALAGKSLLPKGGGGAAGPVAAPALFQALDLSFLGAARQNAKTRAAQAAVWEKDWGRDPFIPQGATSGAGGVNLTLSGIVWDERTPLAMVNDKVLKTGDLIAGYRIVQIKQSSIVVLADTGNVVEIELFKTYGGERA